MSTEPFAEKFDRLLVKWLAKELNVPSKSLSQVRIEAGMDGYCETCEFPAIVIRGQERTPRRGTKFHEIDIPNMANLIKALEALDE